MPTPGQGEQRELERVLELEELELQEWKRLQVTTRIARAGTRAGPCTRTAAPRARGKA